MKNKFLLTTLLLFIAFNVNAEQQDKGIVSIVEEDGSPEVYPWQIKITNGTLTDNSDGTASLAITGGGAPTDATYLTSTSNGSLSAEVNLGALSSGFLYGTVGGGISTISSVGTVDISTNTNLSGDTEIVLTGDALSIASTITRDTEWDTAAEINTATTDADFLTSVGTGTINELTYWSSANTLGTLAVSTYPSLTELSYVKGVSSAIQTQLGGKQATVTEGSLADSTIISADIKDGTIAEADLDIANAAVDEYVLSYEGDTSNFQWVVAGAGGGPTYREITLLPESCVLDDTVPPAITVIESTGTGTARNRVSSFDATTDELTYYTFVLPSDYTASSSPIIDIYWYTNDTTADETCVWRVQVSATTPADADAWTETAMDADIAYVSTDIDTNEANRLTLSTVTLTYATYMDSATAGDVVTICIGRDADSTGGTDDLTSDANLVAIHIKIPRS